MDKDVKEINASTIVTFSILSLIVATMFMGVVMFKKSHPHDKQSSSYDSAVWIAMFGI